MKKQLKAQKKRMILLTETMKTRLEHLLEATRRFMRPEHAHLNQLQEALDAAEAIAPGEMPGDVITLYSTVSVTDLDTKDRRVFTLVFPREANYSENRISVLAPLGAALLGYRPGDVVQTQVPGGQRRLRVEEVLCASGQPAAA